MQQCESLKFAFVRVLAYNGSRVLFQPLIHNLEIGVKCCVSDTHTAFLKERKKFQSY